jgi:ABC-type glycerol-3-phosphate transport system substrate-binding protein
MGAAPLIVFGPFKFAVSWKYARHDREGFIMRRALFFAFLVAGLGLSSPTAYPQGGSDWEQVMALARQESKVAIKGPPATEMRDALIQGFQKKHPQIQLEVNAMTGHQMATKLITELNAGMYSVDLIMTGTTTALETLFPANGIVPIQPFLLGPNVRDSSVWRGKKLNFGDESGQYNLVYSAYVKAPFIYNPNLISPREIQSWKDLLNPKWKGRIVLRDPTGAGGGLGSATFWYTH